MAKKDTNTKTAAKKEKKKKEKVDFNIFIKTTMYEMMKNKISCIKEVCEEYSGIEPMPADKWTLFDTICIEIGKCSPETGVVALRREPLSRGKYGITFKVREKYRKKYILDFINRMNGDDENDLYCCYMVYLHMNVMCSETSKQSK